MTPPCKYLTDSFVDSRDLAKSLPEMAPSTSDCKVSSTLLGEETLKDPHQTPMCYY